ncbi:F-box domain-containing protein [Favolaschia claudopus]|uniref:F-box domain-containing protein n=1 Tax=Favolaschia claudopus TaxID=2862362 RepID=A0AAW0EGP5_9AGAR
MTSNNQVLDTEDIAGRVQDRLTQPTPIHGLPYELLADIMHLALLPSRPTKPDGSPSHLRYADVMVLCRVCSHWRQIAIQTPQLWVELRFPITIYSKDEKTTWNATKTFLERSDPLPISVFLWEMASSDDEIASLLPILVGAAPRWRSLEMLFNSSRGTSPPALDRALESGTLEGRLRNLETLRVDYPKLRDGITAFQLAPRLREASIELRHRSSHVPILPWAQLTRLRLEHDSPQVCFDILASCKSLVSANVSTDQWLDDNAPRFSGTCSLNHLKVLSISVMIRSAGAHVEPFLHHFTPPALTSLTLSLRLGYPVHDDWFISPILPVLILFLSRSPHIEELSLYDCVFSEDMEDILQHTPNLTALNLDMASTGIFDDFFETLQYNPGADSMPLAPKLEVLGLFNVGFEFAEDIFKKMICSRWWTDDEAGKMTAPPRVARWKCIKFWDNHDLPGFSDEFHEEMKRLSSQGLDAEIHYYG